MRRAFTLVELLVITAIIAILAGIAFPVVVAAKAEKIDQQSARRMGQLANATLMYAADNNSIFPLATVCKPDTQKIGTGVFYPFPASSATLGAFGPIWNNPARQNMAQCFWSNSIFPYVAEGADSYKIFGVNFLKLPSDNPKLGPLYDDFATFNGMLHHYSVHSVLNPSAVPLFWAGHGNINFKGRSESSPNLNCGDIGDLCTFNPTGYPSPTGFVDRFGYGDIFFQTVFYYSWWVFGNNRMPMAMADGSAGIFKTGNVIFPNAAPPSSAYQFPFAEVDKNGAAGPDPFNAGGSQYAFWECNQNGPANPDENDPVYWCFFRPDRPVSPNHLRVVP